MTIPEIDHLPPPEELSLRRARTRLDRLSQRIKHIAPAPDKPFRIREFIENLRIIDKRGEVVPLIMNRSQEYVFNRLMECREKRIPARFICCKARQLGISTLIEAFIFALMTRYANRFALVVAHSIESAHGIFGMTRRFLRFVPPAMAVPTARNTLRCIEFTAPHHSRMQIDSAANRSLGRGGTVHYVHASEVAFWERPEEPILAMNQAVPQEWDTLVFWESTANGVQNLFHRAWVAAERGESDMEPIFLSWKSFPAYSIPVAAGEDLKLSTDEEQYSAIHGLSPEQIKWARHARVNQCHNSWDKFHQEYPVAADLAFVFTGMPWFDRDVIRLLLENASEPFQRGFLKYSEESATPHFVSDPRGPLFVWKLPESGDTYSLGMDVGEGVGADYTVIQVICNETREVVACYRSNRVRAEAAGVDAHLLGAWYRFGLLGIERNGPGLATLAVCERGMADLPWMTGYPNLYYHTYTDRKLLEETRRLGWITNRSTKEAMLSRLAQTVEARGLIIASRTTLLEMQGFVWDAEKKVFRQSYKAPDARLTHDDEIMALAIANEMRTHSWENRFIPSGSVKGGEF
jgi:hypothetical protein